MLKIFDFHTHSTLKPYHSKDAQGDFPNPNHWDEPEFESISEKAYNRLVDKLYPQIIIRSQSYLEAYQKGKIKCFCIGLYPLEFGFIRTRNYLKFIQALFGIIADVFGPEHVKFKLKIRRVLAAVIGIHPDRVKSLYNRGYNYYSDLVGEVENLKRQGPRDFQGNPITPTIIDDFEQLAALNTETALALLLSIEGAHAFISTDQIPAVRNKKKLWKNRFRRHYPAIADQALANIIDFKKKYPGLFYVTFGHHFYNLFCGHSKSLPGLLFNQMPRFYDIGISQDGFRLIDALLDRQQVDGQTLPRVLIDTKHMSIRSRVEFHEYVKQKNARGDKIPIIQSHTAVTGRRSMYALRDEQNTEFRIKGEAIDPDIDTFVELHLNLFDDEIVEIIQSDGLIGIMLDEKRILGKTFPSFTPKGEYLFIRDNGSTKRFEITNPSNYKTAKKRLGKCLFRQKYDPDHIEDSSDPDIQQGRERKRQVTEQNIFQIRKALKPILCSLFIHQIRYIVKVYVAALPTGSTNEQKKQAWNHICIGTDFDGVINPLDAYPDGSFLEEFAADVVNHWKVLMRSPPHQEVAQLLFGLSPEEVMEKVVWANAMSFMQKYFSKQYKYALPV